MVAPGDHSTGNQLKQEVCGLYKQQRGSEVRAAPGFFSRWLLQLRVRLRQLAAYMLKMTLHTTSRGKNKLRPGGHEWPTELFDLAHNQLLA